MENEDIKKFNTQLVSPTDFMLNVIKKRETLRDIEKGLRDFNSKAKYIKRGVKEKDEDYKEKVNLCKFYNITNKMIKMNYNRPFTKQSTLSSDDSFIKSLENNFDGFGNNLTTFAKRVFKRSLYDSQAHVFCDFDNDRPVLTLLNNDNILGAFTDEYNELVHLRFITTFSAPDPDNIFDIIELRKVWIFNKFDGEVFYDVYEEFEKGSFVKSKKERIKFNKNIIPLFSYYPDDTETPFDPDLIFADLADKNMEFFGSEAEQRQYLSTARIPILMITGVDEAEGIAVGAKMAVKLSDPMASMKYVEINGASLAAGDRYNDKLVVQMSQMGLELLNKKTNISATGASIDNAQNLSLLTAYAIGFENFLKKIVRFMSDWRNNSYRETDAEFILSIDTDFSTVIDQAELQFMQTLRATGDISGETITNFAKSKGFLPQEFDYYSDQEKIMSNGFTPIDNTSFSVDLDNKLKTEMDFENQE